MPVEKLTPPPAKDHFRFDDWVVRLRLFVNALADTETTGTTTSTTERLTAAQAEDLTDSGDSVLHYHSEDRDRDNHTGTQTVSTISDFDSAVQAIAAATAQSSSGVLEAQIFGS